MVQGHLQNMGVQVQRRKVHWHQALSRRSYSVPGPNGLCHIDGHYSLILWRFEIHGGIDGHSLVIFYLQCTTNNRALSAFTYFWRATWEYGIPSRVRLDKGSENVMVCHFIQGEETTLLVHVLITNTLNDYGAMYIAVLLQHIMSCSTIWKKSNC